MDHENLKNIIREEIKKQTSLNTLSRFSKSPDLKLPEQKLSDKSVPLPSPSKTCSTKSSTVESSTENTRQKNNESVIARWLKNQETPPIKLRRYPNLKLGSLKTSADNSSAGGATGLKQDGQPRASVEPRYNLIEKPKSAQSLLKLLQSTAARVGVGRAGSRPLTKVLLDFQADHAIAKKAVYEEFSKDLVKQLSLFEVRSLIKNKEEFLLRPDLGRQINPECAAAIQKNCIQKPDVQIVVSDGLSGIALKANIEALLPDLTSNLTGQGLSVGTPIYCRFARVAFQDRVGELVNAKTCLILIGERPGLGTGDGLSAYLIYQPNSNSTHANRNCISNIHPRGLLIPDAVKNISHVLQLMIDQKTSGVDLEIN